MVLSPLWYLYLVGNWYCYLKTIPIWILNVTIIVTCRECSRDQSSRCSLRNPLAVGSLTSCSGWRSCKKVGFLFLMEVLQKCVIFLFLMDVLQKCLIFLFLMEVLQKCVIFIFDVGPPKMCAPIFEAGKVLSSSSGHLSLSGRTMRTQERPQSQLCFWWMEVCYILYAFSSPPADSGPACASPLPVSPCPPPPPPTSPISTGTSALVFFLWNRLMSIFSDHKICNF